MWWYYRTPSLCSAPRPPALFLSHKRKENLIHSVTLFFSSSKIPVALPRSFASNWNRLERARAPRYISLSLSVPYGATAVLLLLSKESMLLNGIILLFPAKSEGWRRGKKKTRRGSPVDLVQLLLRSQPIRHQIKTRKYPRKTVENRKKHFQ